MELLITVLAMFVLGFVFMIMLRQNYVLVQQRKALIDALTDEHRMRHGCRGSVWVSWEGVIVHNRISEQEKEGLGSGRS